MTAEITTKDRAITIAIGTLAIAIIFGLYIGANTYIDRKPPPVIILPSEFPDFDAIKGQSPDPNMEVVKISEDCAKEGCINQKPARIDFGGLRKKYTIKGQFARAYLYIEGLVDYVRPLTAWDDIYFKINFLGGHLVKDENALGVPASKSSMYLYDLRAISYYPTIADKDLKTHKISNKNLFNLLQNGQQLDVITSISSDRPGRVIKEVSIYYECFEGSECSIEKSMF